MRLICGFEIIRKRLERNENPSFVAPSNDDGAVIVSAGGSLRNDGGSWMVRLEQKRNWLVSIGIWANTPIVIWP